VINTQYLFIWVFNCLFSMDCISSIYLYTCTS